MNHTIQERLNPMDTSWINTVKSRLSLRTPQIEALEILAIALEQMSEEATLEENLKKIQDFHEGFSGFYFDFPSLCFSIATGVGKTRLMGAMIWWLHKVKKYNNFFVVAPNLTIYEKLVKDFTFGSPKYVFKGIGDFDASNPKIIDGNNYAQINTNDMVQAFDFEEFQNEITINVFNISKFNSTKETTKIKRLSEYIGTSYFQYLQGLKDLVVLMDESHRYKADSSTKAINELNPVLGLEFTATPYYQKSKEGSGKKFENIVYEYNLANAIQDGYVKTPAVATRSNFNNDMSEAEKDFIKLQDGIYIHENTRLDLQLYAQNHAKKAVKPFVLVSAKDQQHAQEIEDLIKSDTFFEGNYKDKVIKVISGGKAEDRDEAIRLLLSVENSDNPIEIVIQVMMLKEGWDVNNLYTIVPLRASASETLTEQTLGRGLRLPFGQRTGDDNVDRLTIVAHGEYQKIVDIANNPNSLIKNIISLDDRSGFGRPRQLVINTNVFDDVERIIEASSILSQAIASGTIDRQEAIELTHQMTKNITEEVIKKETTLTNSSELQGGEMKQDIDDQVAQRLKNLSSTQPKISSTIAKIGFEKMIEASKQVSIFFIDEMVEKSIDLPEIIYDYGETLVEFDQDFELSTDFIDGVSIQNSEIVIKDLTTNQVVHFERPQSVKHKGGLEKYCEDLLFSINEIDDSRDGKLMYRCVEKIVETLRDKFPRESEDTLVARVAGMKNYLKDHVIKQITQEGVMTISQSAPTIELLKGFKSIRSVDFDAYAIGGVRKYFETGFERSEIKNLAFRGFQKCVSKYVKFDSDTERIFSVILEDDMRVLKWMKPPLGVFKIFYRFQNTTLEYFPDFIVETSEMKYIVEIKSENDLDDAKVQAKALSANKWCEDVNPLISGKKWKYVLIPHTQVQQGRTLDYVLMFGHN